MQSIFFLAFLAQSKVSFHSAMKVNNDDKYDHNSERVKALLVKLVNVVVIDIINPTIK